MVMQKWLTRSPFMLVAIAYISVIPFTWVHEPFMMEISLLLCFNLAALVALYNLVIRHRISSSVVALSIIFVSFFFTFLQLIA